MWWGEIMRKSLLRETCKKKLWGETGSREISEEESLKNEKVWGESSRIGGRVKTLSENSQRVPWWLNAVIEKIEGTDIRNNTQLWMRLVMESKVWCCKEQYCIGTWNVRSMNWKVVKQEMARVNVNILGIGELKWSGMSEFNSDDHYIYSCGQESLRRNGVAIIDNKSLKCSNWMQSQKRQNDLCSFPR